METPSLWPHRCEQLVINPLTTCTSTVLVVFKKMLCLVLP